MKPQRHSHRITVWATLLLLVVLCASVVNAQALTISRVGETNCFWWPLTNNSLGFTNLEFGTDLDTWTNLPAPVVGSGPAWSVTITPPPPGGADYFLLYHWMNSVAEVFTLPVNFTSLTLTNICAGIHSFAFCAISTNNGYTALMSSNEYVMFSWHCPTNATGFYRVRLQ